MVNDKLHAMTLYFRVYKFCMGTCKKSPISRYVIAYKYPRDYTVYVLDLVFCIGTTHIYVIS